jgi:hypothetical protein
MDEHVRSGWRRAVLAGPLSVVMTGGVLLANPDEAPRQINTPLFWLEPAATALLSTGIAPSTVAIERRVVTIDPDTIESLVEDGAAELTIDLPGMGEVIIDIRRRIHHPGGEVALIGRVRGDAPSRVILEIGDGLLIGDVIRGHDMVQIRQTPEHAFDMLGERSNTLHLVQSVREQVGAICGNELIDMGVGRGPSAQPPLKKEPYGGGRHHEGDDPPDGRNPFVDVMVVYTDGARAAIGSHGAARLLSLLAVDTANEIYIDSGVDHRLRMARMYEVTYDETGGTHNDHLDAITDEDGVIDGVHDIRDAVGADVVTFMIDDLDPGVGCGTCITYGLAWRPSNESSDNEDVAFHTCHWENMATPTWSMQHEAGHNFGAYHDDQQVPTDYIALYGRGHYWNNSAGTRERSIMCRNALGGTRIPYFSNPDVDFNGNATGDSTHDAARLFDLTSDTVSGYRAASSTTVYVDTDWTGSENGTNSNPYDTLWEGYINVRWGGTVIMKSCEDDSMTGPIRRMLIKSTGGSSVIRRAP